MANGMDPRAAEAIDREVDAILDLFTASDHAVRQPGWSAPAHAVRHLTESDLEGVLRLTDIDGRSLDVLAFTMVEKAGSARVVNAAGYGRLQSLCARVLRDSLFSNVTTLEAIQEHAEQWLQARLFGRPEEAPGTFTEFLTARIQDEVQTFTVWVPLRDVEVEGELALGHGVLRTITPQDELRLLHGWLAKAGPVTAAQTHEVQSLLRRVMGLTVIVVESHADLSRAQANAMEKAEEIATVLRCLQPINMCCEARSYLEPVARTRMEGVDSITLLDDVLFTGGSSPRTALPFPLRLSERRRSEPWLKRQLTEIHALLSASARSDFQKKLFHALLAYGNAAVSRSPGEKLVLTFAALETLLLLNDNEPIQQNLGRRMALLVETTLEARKQVVVDAKRAYALRSKFMHHGERPNREQFAVINRMLVLAYTVFMKALQLQEELANWPGLGQWIEDRIFSEQGLGGVVTELVPMPDEPVVGRLVQMTISLDP